MEEQTRKLLEECNSGCKMAIRSIEQVEEFASGTKLKETLEYYKQKHQDLEAETGKRLMEYGEKGKEPKAAATAFSWLTTEMKLMIRGNANQIAHIMLDGCNMGIQSITEDIHELSEASDVVRKLAERIVHTEEEFAKKLKEFL